MTRQHRLQRADPTPEEITEACRTIQARWPPAERRRRERIMPKLREDCRPPRWLLDTLRLMRPGAF
jgi:hypothetical protein